MRFYERYLRSGRKLSGRKRLLPLLFFFSLLAAIFFTTPFSMCRGWLLSAAALLVAVSGLAVRWNASKCASGNPVERAAAGGIWSAVRFPYYLSDLLLIYSVSLYAGMVWYLFFIVPVSLLAVGRIIAFEEHAAISKYGEEYLQWCRNTGALIPRIFAWSPSGCRRGFVSLLRAVVRPMFAWSAACLAAGFLKNYRMDFAFRPDYIWVGLSVVSALLWMLVSAGTKNK